MLFFIKSTIFFRRFLALLSCQFSRSSRIFVVFKGKVFLSVWMVEYSLAISFSSCNVCISPVFSLYVNTRPFHSCWPFRFAHLSLCFREINIFYPFNIKNISSFPTSFAYWSLLSGNPCAHMVNTDVFSCNCCFIHPSCRILPIWQYFMFDYSNICLWSDNNAMSQLSQVCIWNYLVLSL